MPPAHHCCWRDHGLGLGLGRSTVGADPDVGRTIGDHEDDHRNDREGCPGDDERGIPPAGSGRERSDRGQEDELAGRGGRREEAGDQAPSGLEPPVGDDRPEDQGHRPSAQPDEPAPEDPQLPGRGHHRRQPAADPDEQQRGDDDPAQAQALHEGGGERRRQAIDDEVGGHSARSHGAAPPELLLEGLDERARRGPETSGGDQGAQHGQGHPPRAVDRAASGRRTCHGFSSG